MAATAVNGAAGFSSSGPAATSGAVLQAATGMYEQLKGEWNRKSPNLSKCGEELGRLKLVLLELNFLPTTGTKLTKQQLILARECHWGYSLCHPQVTYWRSEPSGASCARTSPPSSATWPSSNATTLITSENGSCPQLGGGCMAAPLPLGLWPRGSSFFIWELLLA
uniref:Proteasome 26S subunit, non-ATPase 8 n=1 Tax=Theropithecus gelada TaxID=9565 RepID=A0A8D2FI32_THEGE